ncbi:hypothetical protein TD95_000229 [Thielaviopsis punctulata]|uniref:Spo12 family protein n=1 Tax=Thielaviopsis punctulata TaxID=72032 RepID=A0A0F4ZE45_9PEZI|nr:hypothetical protein TD95_000229 [Thielaviopsis punctulata]
MSSFVNQDVEMTCSPQPKPQTGPQPKGPLMSLEYHRQMLHNKMKTARQQKFFSPSDTLMSPCTQKLNALRTKQASRMKPRSLFATSTRKLAEGDDLFAPKKSS